MQPPVISDALTRPQRTSATSRHQVRLAHQPGGIVHFSGEKDVYDRFDPPGLRESNLPIRSRQPSVDSDDEPLIKKRKLPTGHAATPSSSTITNSAMHAVASVNKTSAVTSIRKEPTKADTNIHLRLPWEDPLNPQYCVSELADPNDPRYCDKRVQLVDLLMTRTSKSDFQQIYGRRAGKTMATHRRNAIERINRMIDRTAEPITEYDIDLFTKEDMRSSDEKSMVGQDTLRALKDFSGDGTTSLGPYRGGFVQTQTQKKALLKKYGANYRLYVFFMEWRDPLTGKKRRAEINGLGSGGHLQSMNTRLKRAVAPWTGLDYDLKDMDVIFTTYVAVFRDAKGNFHSYPYVEATPIRPVKAGRDLRVDYGPERLFLLMDELLGDDNPYREQKNMGKLKREASTNSAMSLDQFSPHIESSDIPQTNLLTSHDGKRSRESSFSTLSSISSEILEREYPLEQELLPPSFLEGRERKNRFMRSSSPDSQDSSSIFSEIDEDTSSSEDDSPQGQFTRGRGKHREDKERILRELSPDSSGLMERLDLSHFWANALDFISAKKAALFAERNPNMDRREMSRHLMAEGVYAPHHSLYNWGIRRRNELSAEATRLQETLGLTQIWVQSKNFENALNIARYLDKNPDMLHLSTRELSKQLKALGMQASDDALTAWGLGLRKDGQRGLSPESRRLKDELGLTDRWANATDFPKVKRIALILEKPENRNLSLAKKLQVLTANSIKTTRSELSKYGFTTSKESPYALQLKEELGLTDTWLNAKDRNRALKVAEYVRDEVIAKKRKPSLSQMAAELNAAPYHIKVDPGVLSVWGMTQ